MLKKKMQYCKPEMNVFEIDGAEAIMNVSDGMLETPSEYETEIELS